MAKSADAWAGDAAGVLLVGVPHRRRRRLEELVRRLEPRELPPEVGKRAMDVSEPGFGMAPSRLSSRPER